MTKLGYPKRLAAAVEAARSLPFDFTLTFCEVLPPTEKAVRAAAADRVLKAPVRAKIVVPMGFVPNLINALQEHLHACTESGGSPGWDKPAVH